MPQRRITVTSPVGLHARPAALFAQAAQDAGTVTVSKPGGSAVNAQSILSLLSLDVRGGEEIVVRAEGDNAEAVLEELARIATAEGSAHD
jgi:phosphocarrier protein HPr